MIDASLPTSLPTPLSTKARTWSGLSVIERSFPLRWRHANSRDLEDLPMKFPTIASIGLAAACLVGGAHAQSAPSINQEEMQKRAAAVSATLAPLVSKTAEETTEAQLKIAERADTAERIATFKKNLFDALRRKGFTVEQAMQLTAATSVAPFTSH